MNVLGWSHLDYQSLRYARASAEEGPVEIIEDTTEMETDTGTTSPEGDRESGEFVAAKSEAS